MSTADKVYWTFSIIALAVIAILVVIAKLWFDD